MRLVVFDFDKTIMKEHIWGKYRNAPLEIINFCDEEFANLPRFRALIAGIKQRGHVAAVASFGRHDVVDKALKYALGDDHGIAIRTPSDFGEVDGSSALGDKNKQLAALAARFGVSANQIILIDDDQKNVVAAQKAGTQGLFAPDGLTRNHVKEVARNVGVYEKMTTAYQHPEAFSSSVAPNPRTIPADECARLAHRLSSGGE
jgi:phosphoserine phosphatase